MDSKYFRPAIPRDLKRAAMEAGAPMLLSARDYVVLALRDALRRSGRLPPEWEMSDEEITACGRGARRES